MVTAPGIVARLALWIEAAVKGTTTDFEVYAVSVINIHLIVQHVAPAPRGEHYHLDHEQMQPESRHALSHSLDQTTPWPIVNARARLIPVFGIKTTSDSWLEERKPQNESLKILFQLGLLCNCIGDDCLLVIQIFERRRWGTR